METIDNELWKKYVIYAKNFNPQLSDSVKEKIRDLYVSIRKQSQIKKQENDMQIISITARQGDAFRRLAEASARMHLRDVTTEDVEVARDLIMKSLKDVALDLESGRIDIDKVEIGISSKTQHIIHQIRQEMVKLEKVFKDVPIEELAKPFKDKETEFEEALQKLIRSGDYFEPRRGFVKRL